MVLPGGGCALPGLQDPFTGSHPVGPASAAPPGKISGTVSLISPGGGCALPGLQPQITAGAGVAETADAGGLNIAETFPEGRGSPHGCGLRAVFCTDAASARPEACREKSKVPRSGDFAGRSPGVQGATGRPLCAPCTMSDITQKKYRERNLPGNNRKHRFFQGRHCCKPITVSTPLRRYFVGWRFTYPTRLTPRQ